MRVRRTVLALVAIFVPTLLAAQKPTGSPTNLALGTAVSGSTHSSNGAAIYRVTTTGAGIITVAAFGEGDLTLAVTDEDGQQLRDGTADTDYRGKMGAEYLAVPVPGAGTYGVEVRANGGGAIPFRVIATFAAMSGFEMPADTDGRPRNARAIAVGAAMEDQLNPDEGDLADWYLVTASEAMTIIFGTRVDEGSEGDLMLDAYIGEDLNNSVAHSDQDLRGNSGNESLTVDLKPGESVRIKVASLSDTGSRVAYRVSVGRMP